MVLMHSSPASPDNESIRKIAKYAEQQGKQTNWIIALTIALFILAVIQTILLILQISK